jgi:molecular chaperone HscB
VSQIVKTISNSWACWKCGHEEGRSLFCTSCHALQPPAADYYTLLAIPRKLSLQEQELQRRFYELSRQLHPDRFMRRPEREREYSLDASSVLNDAYRTLRDPVKRAQYFLKQEGFDIGEQRSKDVPPELLEEVFELNMALEELRGGDSSARPQLEAAQTNFAAMLSAADAQLTDLFHQYDASPAPDKLEQIRAVLNRRKYIENLVNEVRGALQ